MVMKKQNFTKSKWRSKKINIKKGHIKKTIKVGKNQRVKNMRQVTTSNMISMVKEEMIDIIIIMMNIIKKIIIIIIKEIIMNNPPQNSRLKSLVKWESKALIMESLHSLIQISIKEIKEQMIKKMNIES